MIIALGVLFVLTPFVPKLNREWRPDALISRAGSGGPLIAGAAFAFAWTPCIGPTLGAILTAASTQDNLGDGAVLLFFYSLGLSIPFLLTAFAFTRAWGAFRWLRDRYIAHHGHLRRRADHHGRPAPHRRAHAPQHRGPAGAGLARPQLLRRALTLNPAAAGRFCPYGARPRHVPRARGALPTGQLRRGSATVRLTYISPQIEEWTGLPASCWTEDPEHWLRDAPPGRPRAGRGGRAADRPRVPHAREGRLDLGLGARGHRDARTPARSASASTSPRCARRGRRSTPPSGSSAPSSTPRR